MSKKVKKLVEFYEYKDLGFTIILRDVPIVQDRDYEYALINHQAIINQAAFNLVMKHERIDGSRLKFLRKFIGLSLDQLSELTSIPKSTLHNWEKEAGKALDIPGEKLRAIFLEVRNTLTKSMSSKLDSAIVKDIINKPEISPLLMDDVSLAI